MIALQTTEYNILIINYYIGENEHRKGLKMTIRKKLILLFIFASMLLLGVIIVAIIMRKKSEDVLFHDNAKFQEFTINNEQPFSIIENAKVKVEFECEITAGALCVEILNSEKEVIFTKDASSEPITSVLELSPGCYYYHLFADHAKGRFLFRGRLL